MAVIKSGATTDQLTVDPTSKAARVTLYDTSGNANPAQTVSVSNFPATQPVSGTITANAGTGNFTVTQATAANLNTTVTGSISVSNFPATQTVQDTADGTIGSIVSTIAQLQGGSDGTNLRAIRTDAAGNQTVTNAGIAAYAATSAAFTPAAGDIFQIIGSATKTVKIRRIILSGVATTAGNVNTIALIKRSTADTAGTPVTATNVSFDSSLATATSVVTTYTAAPTPGTTVGTIYQPRVQIPATTTTGTPATIMDIELAQLAFVPIVLRGVAQALCINLSAVPTGAATFQVSVIWTEE